MNKSVTANDLRALVENHKGEIPLILDYEFSGAIFLR